LAVFVVPFLALLFYFLFTFSRSPIDYKYPTPGLRSMASVLYELAGLANFGPNTKLSLDFAGSALSLAIGGTAIVLSAGLLAWQGWRHRSDRIVISLCAASVAGFFEAVLLAVLLHRQPDARHLAALLPPVLLLLPALARDAVGAAKDVLFPIFLLGAAWLAADVRGLALPRYQREDFRIAAQAAVSAQQQTGGDVALDSDTVGAAYYGLTPRGPAPCFPIVFDCNRAFALVPWETREPAWDASSWSRDEIQNWLNQRRESGRVAIVLQQLDRSRRYSAWWPILAQASTAYRTRVHGFEIVLIYPAAPEPLLR
jgi:hypothetical protein